MRDITRYPRIVVAGLKGGSGKTTLSLGLIAAWKEKGLAIVPYKKGPDYIDAGWLSSAAGNLCYNLDPFLIGREKLLSSFIEHFGNADCALIEGNRGLYDGMDVEGTYSTAELSKVLKSPVLLILDCTKSTRTMGAIVLGAQKFDRKVNIRGVVLNQIAGSRHEKIVTEVIEKYCGLPVLGSIPKLGGDLLSERHMGLTPFQEHPEVGAALSSVTEIAKKYLDLDRIWKIANEARPLPPHPPLSKGGKQRGVLTKGGRRGADSSLLTPHPSSVVTIGIIRDSAFQFYYPENFEELEKRGARLLEISALKEKTLPDVDALYVGGGFPETNAISLAGNVSFRRSLKKAVEEGLPVYAECGGLMYLGRTLFLGGKKYAMAGIFPLSFCLEKKPQAHGYTIVEAGRGNPFYDERTVLKGHEFHYSRAIDFEEKDGVSFSFSMKRGQGIMDKKDGICYRRAMGTYTHLHAYGAPEWADGLVGQAVLYRKERAGIVDKKRDR
jgi:cobyrinic acid a,c-diamide synthase